jgi:hypothetical protein
MRPYPPEGRVAGREEGPTVRVMARSTGGYELHKKARISRNVQVSIYLEIIEKFLLGYMHIIL